MNLLPFLFVMLIIFTFITTSFFQKLTSVEQISRVTLAKEKLEEKHFIEETRKSYKRILGKEAKKKTLNEKKNSTEQELVYFREKHLLAVDSKLFISTLFTDTPIKNLYTHALNLLKECYGSHFKVDDLETLLKVLIQEGKKGLELTFENLFPEDEKLCDLYYKLLQGTRLQEGGYPPLSDIISLESRNEIAYFNVARPDVLSALFGKSSAEKIIQEEKEKLKDRKNEPLRHQDIQKLLPGHEIPIKLSFGKKGRTTKNQVITFDEKTQVSYRARTSAGRQ